MVTQEVECLADASLHAQPSALTHTKPVSSVTPTTRDNSPTLKQMPKTDTKAPLLPSSQAFSAAADAQELQERATLNAANAQLHPSLQARCRMRQEKPLRLRGTARRGRPNTHQTQALVGLESPAWCFPSPANGRAGYRQRPRHHLSPHTPRPASPQPGGTPSPIPFMDSAAGSPPARGDGGDGGGGGAAGRPWRHVAAPLPGPAARRPRPAYRAAGRPLLELGLGPPWASQGPSPSSWMRWGSPARASTPSSPQLPQRGLGQQHGRRHLALPTGCHVTPRRKGAKSLPVPGRLWLVRAACPLTAVVGGGGGRCWRTAQCLEKRGFAFRFTKGL